MRYPSSLQCLVLAAAVHFLLCIVQTAQHSEHGRNLSIERALLSFVHLCDVWKHCPLNFATYTSGALHVTTSGSNGATGVVLGGAGASLAAGSLALRSPSMMWTTPQTTKWYATTASTNVWSTVIVYVMAGGSDAMARRLCGLSTRPVQSALWGPTQRLCSGHKHLVMALPDTACTAQHVHELWEECTPFE